MMKLSIFCILIYVGQVKRSDLAANMDIIVLIFVTESIKT